MARLQDGRAARASELIGQIADLLPLGHPARPAVKELEHLFSLRSERIRELLEQVPGKSLAQKGKRIGIPKGAVWSIWNGRYKPTAEVMARIEAAAQEKVDA